MIVVPPSGPSPSPVLLVGEAPGREEAKEKKPFVGASGREQAGYLLRAGLSSLEYRQWRMTNVVQEYQEGNPDPTPGQISYWSGELEREVKRTNPKLIVAVGRFAARWFLGSVLDMETVVGIPHAPGEWGVDEEETEEIRRRVGVGRVVVPIYHPAVGLYDGEMRAQVSRGYKRVVEVWRAIEWSTDPDLLSLVRQTPIYPNPVYIQDDGVGICNMVGREFPPPTLSLDTEGVPGSPWSLQVTKEEGSALVLLNGDGEWGLAIEALQAAADNGTAYILHNALYDVPMCREMGLELQGAKWWDTMYAAYLLRLEPQRLKALAWRHAGMKMREYGDLVRGSQSDKWVEYLADVMTGTWAKPEKVEEEQRDGTTKWRQPKKTEALAEGILRDYYSGKVNKDGEGVDFEERWEKVGEGQREEVEKVLGPPPITTLDDVELGEVIQYAGADSDATLRIKGVLEKELEKEGLTPLMSHGMKVLPIFEEMQWNGMWADVGYFEAFRDRLKSEMVGLRDTLSSDHYYGRPINPKSDQDTRNLMRLRGLKGSLKTKGGLISTSKKSIEHLQEEDEAIRLVFEYRQRQHILDSFVAPVLAIAKKGSVVDGLVNVKCWIKTTRTATRRLATSNPNLLAIPSRTDLGIAVRKGYVAPPGYVLGSWDLSQIEARVLAHFSGDEVLTELFWAGRDIHTETAARMFGVGLEQVEKAQRSVAKTINFGVFYGMSAQGLETQLRSMGLKGWGVEECERALTAWFKTYKGVERYIRETGEEVRRDKEGRVWDHWGMVRYIPGIHSRDIGVRSEAERVAVSHRIQGGAQGMIQNSMVWIDRELGLSGLREKGEVSWRLQIHDELVFMMKDEERVRERMGEVVMEGLTKHSGIELSVPVLAEGRTAYNWGDLK